MSSQIAIRLPEEMVAFLDEAVTSGRARSRAAVVASALEREMRRVIAERDVALLRERGTEDELDPLVAWAVAQSETEG